MKGNPRFLIFSIIAFMVCFHCVTSVAAVQCRSYGGQNGQCVDLSRCPPLLAVILSQEKTAEHIRMLQQLTCLSESQSASEPVVCCPLGEIVSDSYIKKDVLQEPHTTAKSRTTTRRTTTDRSYTVGRISPTLAPGPSLEVYPVRRKPERPVSSSRPGGDRLELERKFRTLIPPLENCSVSNILGERIIGGKDATHGEYPWMARLGYRNLKSNKVEYYCGGVIINKRYILTAAHCTYGYDDTFELVHVRLGEHNTKEHADCSSELNICSVPEDFPVEDVITHPEYNTDTKHNDIALVRVNRDIKFQSYFIRPVCLPFMKEYGLQEPKTLNSLNGIVAGWGRTNWTRSEGSNILQHVKLPIVSREKCVKDFRNRVNIMSTQLCAGGERNQDSCGGDSGGPLMVDTIERRGSFQIKKKFQYGIVSFGPVKCGIGIPGVYTRVTEYLPWILKNIDP